MNVTVGEVFSEGWSSMKMNYVDFLKVSALYILIVSVMIIALAIPIAGLLPHLLFFGPLMAGISYVGVEGYRGRTQLSSLFTGFQKWGHALCLHWLLGVFSVIMTIPVIICMAVANGIDSRMQGPGIVFLVFGLLVSLVSIVIVGLRLSMSWPCLLDKNLGVIQAIGRSWGMSRDRVPVLLGLGLLVCLIQVLLLVPVIFISALFETRFGPGHILVLLSFLAYLFLSELLLGMPLKMGIWGAAYCILDETEVNDLQMQDGFRRKRSSPPSSTSKHTVVRKKDERKSIHAECPNCGRDFRRPAAMEGAREKCPECKHVMVLPGAS